MALILVVCGSIGPAVGAGPDPAATPDPAAAPDPGAGAAPDPWSDPEFQRQFLGTYGVSSELEPRLNPAERDLLQRVLPLMGSNPPEAIRVLRSGMKPGSSASLDFTLGNLLFQQGQVEEAAAAFRTAVGKFPGFRRAHRNLGLAEFRLGHQDAAIQAFARTLELGGGDAMLFGLLGYAHAAKGDYLAAEGAYRSALLLQPGNTDWRIGLARCILKQQKPGEAVALLDVLIESQPDHAEFWLLQANAFIALRQPLKAAENLEVVRRLGQATPDTQFLLGDIYVNENLPDLAAGAYAAAIDLDPLQAPGRAIRSAEALVARGAMDPGRTVAARIRAAFADRLADDERRAVLRLEARMAVAAGDGGEAVRILEEIVAADPLDGDALMLLGEHHARAGDPDRALLYYDRAGSLEPFEAPARIRQAQIQVGRGKFQEALPLLRRAQEIRPRDEIARYIEQVERLSRTQRQ
jgi:tetratricopeptide (TPR) repeat protein